MRALAYALRRLRRGWRSGELLILSLAVAVAVAAVSSVGLFSSRMRQAIANQTGDTLGADLMFSSRDPIPEKLLNSAGASGARQLSLITFPSVILHGEHTTLASIRAVTAGYPLRGRMRITDEPFGVLRDASGIPQPGEAWADLRLWQELNLGAGSGLQAGALTLKVRAVLAEEPGRGLGFADLAPRLLINQADLAATGLLAPGARAEYALMTAGNAAVIAALRALELPRGVKRQSPQDAQPELMQPVRESGDFLWIARISASLMAAAAIALCAWQWGLKLRDEVALLKCLGASSRFVLLSFSLMVLLLGCVASFAGALVGLGAQELLARMLGSLMQIELPPPSLEPLRQAWAVALMLLLGFALPPILQARSAAPIRVFQRDPTVPTQRLPMAGGVLGVLALFWLQTANLKAGAVVLAAVLGVAGILATLAWALVLGLAPLKRAVGTSWRFGLGNIARRRGATVAQVVALGLALLALLLVSVVRQDLLSTWRRSLPPDTPNQFLINIQPAQVEPLRKFLAAHALSEPRFWPMARGRLTHFNGKPVTDDTFEDPEAQRWIRRDFNMSWSATLNPDNEITQGQWWGEDGAGHPWLSADEFAVDRLKLKLGDRLTLDFAGQSVEFTVHNFRKVKWDSFRPNFFLLAPPGVLEERAPAQWLTSFFLAQGQRSVLRDLIRAFPGVTVLDVESLMNQVRGIMERIVRAVEFIFLFTLAAGFTVLLAAIEGTRGERVRETGLLRALGASRRVITQGLLTEYAVLGLLAGTVAAVAAQTLAWVLAEQVFRIPYGLRPLLWLAGTGAGALLVTLLGWLSLRSTLKTPPHTVLRGTI